MLEEKTIKNIRVLYANGLSITKIHELTNIPRSTVARYTKGTAKIPQHLRKNPFNLFEEMSQEQQEIVLQAEEITVENLQKRGIMTDIDQYLAVYERGTRFLPHINDKAERIRLLNLLSLEQLQEICEVPTGYHSPLPMKDWADYYLAGREGRFLKEAPHKWCKTQNDTFDLWEEHSMLMVETFRDMGKTMGADAVVSHEICEHPDNNYFIMSETQVKAGDRVKHIADTLLTNRLLIADYGFLPAVKKYEGTRQTWRGHKFTVKRHFHQTDPTLIAFSSESTVATGAHYAGGVFDDVWSFGLEQNSERNKEKWLGWRDGELEGCMEHAWELWLLTRKGPNDLYQEIEDRQFHVVHKVPAVKKFPSKYEVLFKEVKGKKVFDKVVVYTDDWEISEDGNGRFTIEYFIEKMSKMDKVKWESEYQLNPIAATGKYWDFKDLRYITGYQGFYSAVNNYSGSKEYRIVGFMDLAFGTSERADYTALVIMALWERRFYWLETYIKRGATKQNIRDICREACNTFPNLRIIYIEDDLQQSHYVQDLKNMIDFVIVKGFSSRQEMNKLKREDSARRVNLDGKPLRIWCQLEPIITANNLFINKYMKNYKEFKDEFRLFPSCKHFDVLDAGGNAVGVFKATSAFFFVLSG